MMLKRPLMYLSLPGIALVLGLIWIRRRKKIPCSDDDTTKVSAVQASEPVAVNTVARGETKSQPINYLLENNRNATETKLGKSAPINISTGKKCDVTQDATSGNIAEVLNSIEEKEFESISPIDLPDSGDRRRFVYSMKRNVADEKPIIIKATQPPKISPKHSFIEAKYIENTDADDKIMASLKQNDPEILNDETTTLASPPLSLCGSRHSTDSGKGSSPPRSEGAPIISYDFLVSQMLIGQILGRKGSFRQQIKLNTGANLMISKYQQSHRVRVCSLEGTQPEIDAALEMIRQRLPAKRYPSLNLDRVVLIPMADGLPLGPVDPSSIQLKLIDSINNDVTVSSIITGGHLFLQQPLHPSFPWLSTLNKCMNQSYSAGDTPMLPEDVTGAICAGRVHNMWYRVQIISQIADSYIVKFLDYGGYTCIESSELRQIRADFMTMPFQAIECVMSNIQPTGKKLLSLVCFTNLNIYSLIEY